MFVRGAYVWHRVELVGFVDLVSVCGIVFSRAGSTTRERVEDWRVCRTCRPERLAPADERA